MDRSVVHVEGRVKLVELFTGLFTALKLLGIAAIVGVGLVLESGGPGMPATPLVTGTRDTLGAFGLALVSVFFSYGGWHHASYLSGEARNARRTIPRAMVLGALVVTVTYVSINIAMLRLLGVEGDHIIGVFSDELDRQEVRVHALQRDPSSRVTPLSECH